MMQRGGYTALESATGLVLDQRVHASNLLTWVRSTPGCCAGLGLTGYGHGLLKPVAAASSWPPAPGREAPGRFLCVALRVVVAARRARLCGTAGACWRALPPANLVIFGGRLWCSGHRLAVDVFAVAAGHRARSRLARRCTWHATPRHARGSARGGARRQPHTITCTTDKLPGRPA